MVTVWKHSNLPVVFATWNWAVCPNLCGRCELSSCVFNCLSKQILIIRARGGARGVPGEATAPKKFCLVPQWPPQNFSGLPLKVLHRPLTAPLVAKLAPPVAPPNENVWLRPWLGLMFGDWLTLWLKLTILFSKAYSIHLHYAIHFTNNVRQSQAFNWVILSQTIQLVQVNETSHDSAEWSCCRKVCAKREVTCKRYLP